MLELQKISKRYNGKSALKGISLSFPQGQIVGLFGENGAGKTTLMKAILGFIPHDGEVTLDGKPVSHKNITRISFATGEHSFFPGLSAAGHRDFYEAHFKTFLPRRFDGLMKFFDLPLHKPIGRLSTGQKNQFEVILALSQGADYILMDEPFSGNDLFNREDFYKVLLGILEPNETVILSTHLIEEVAGFIGRAVLIRGGEILADVTMEELEEQGISLVDYVKTSYHYRPDRVSRALGEIMGEEDAI